MLIIIEGVDCSGKSTLALELYEILSKIHPTEIIHRGIPEEHMLIEYEDAIRNYGSTEMSIIADRWHVGPDVYGPIKRGDNGLDPVLRWHIESYLNAKGGLLVYTEAPLNVIYERMSDRGEEYVQSDDIKPMIEAYHSAIETSIMKTHISLTGEHNVHYILQDARVTDALAQNTKRLTSYVGPRRPKKLYVGNSPDVIAFMPYEGTSSYEIVKKHHGPGVGFIDFRELTNRVWDELFNPFVFALDELALSRCQSEHIPFETIQE